MCASSKDCSDLIGRPYRLGADGTENEIDCIHLVYEVLKRHSIPTPPFQHSWYSASRIQIARDLLRWGKRVERPTYDGDVLLLRQERLAFAVTWQTGILYINRHLGKVAWTSSRNLIDQPCFRSRSN